MAENLTAGSRSNVTGSSPILMPTVKTEDSSDLCDHDTEASDNKRITSDGSRIQDDSSSDKESSTDDEEDNLWTSISDLAWTQEIGDTFDDDKAVFLVEVSPPVIPTMQLIDVYYFKFEMKNINEFYENFYCPHS